MTRRVIAVVAGVIVLVMFVVLAGRWEERRAIRSQNAGMARVLAAVGSVKTAIPTGYRIAMPFCLAYTDGVIPYAYQLCWDGKGRLVETVDRRHGKPKYSSLTWDPAGASSRISVAELVHLFKRATVPPVRARRSH